MFVILYCKIDVFVFVQEIYSLTICSVFYEKFILYNKQEERLKKRYVQLRQRYSSFLHMDGYTWYVTQHK